MPKGKRVEVILIKKFVDVAPQQFKDHANMASKFEVVKEAHTMTNEYQGVNNRIY